MNYPAASYGVSKMFYDNWEDAVIPAKAGIYSFALFFWIPAFAGMTGNAASCGELNPIFD